MDPDKVVESVVSAYARRKGIPEDQARQVLAPLLAKRDRLEELRRFFEEVGAAAELMSKLPEDARDAVASVLVREAVAPEDDESSSLDLRSIQRLAVNVAVARELIRALIPPEEGKEGSGSEALRELVEAFKAQAEALREENRRLAEELARLREEVAKRKEEEREEKLVKGLKAIAKRVKEVAKRVEEVGEEVRKVEAAAAAAGREVRVEEESAVKRLSKELSELKESLNSAIELVESLGMKVMKPDEIKSSEARAEVEKTKTDAISEVIKGLGSSLAELVKEPKKIAEAIKALREASHPALPPEAIEQAAERQPPPAPEGPPSFEEYLRRRGVERGGGEGGT